jgi:hypothetical protein
MRKATHPGDRSRHPWSALLWLLPVLLLLGVTQFGPVPDQEVHRTNPPAAGPPVSAPKPLPGIDHASVNWELYQIEPAQPEQSVAAYERD